MTRTTTARPFALALAIAALALGGCIAVPDDIEEDLEPPDGTRPNNFGRFEDGKDEDDADARVIPDRPTTAYVEPAGSGQLIMSKLARCVLASAALVIAGTGCGQSFRRLNVLDVRETEATPLSYGGLPLKTGAVVLAEAPGAGSFLFALGPARFYPFTHAGILVMEEDGQPYIYDMSGEIKPRPGHTTVQDAVVGGARRSPFFEWCATTLYVEVFEPPAGVDGEKIGAFARDCLAREVQLDARFDWTEHEKLFCTEFVQLALEAGGAPTIELVPARSQPSLRRLQRWLGVDQDLMLPAGMFHDRSRRVAALGMLPSCAWAIAYFAAKKELHRRFADDQQLGNIFRRDGFGIGMRPEIERFLDGAVEPFVRRDDPVTPELEAEIETAVRAVADAMFGACAATAPTAPSGPSAAPTGPAAPADVPKPSGA